MKSPLRRYRQLWSELSMVDGILTRHRRPGPRDDSKQLILLPSALIPSVLKELHNSPLGGHLGVNKTTSRALERYYWPGYSADIGSFIQTCDVCQRRKTTVPSPQTALQSIPVGSVLKKFDDHFQSSVNVTFERHLFFVRDQA